MADGEHTTYSLRDLGISPGQAKHEELALELVPYVQGAVEFADDHGGGKAPKSATPAAKGIEYAPRATPVPAALDVTAMTEGHSFRLRFDATFVGPCSRCLEDAAVDISVDSHVVHDADSDEEELRSDHVSDQRNELDVTGWAQEEVGVQFPTQVLCRPDCRGLCPQCGLNRNEHSDHVHEQPTDSRWDALKGLQLEDE
jgi:uncharacterized protein